MTKTHKELFEIGRAHALEAIDQAESFGGRENSIYSYRENLWDTLRDLGVDCDPEAVYAADDGFNAALKQSLPLMVNMRERVL